MTTTPPDRQPLRSFLEVLDGLGPVGARRLRERGMFDWLDVLNGGGQLSLFPGRLAQSAAEAHDRLASGDFEYFAARLPARLRYVLALAFPDRVTFLDIEATGLSRVYHTLTVLGWACSGQFNFELVGRARKPSPDFVESVAAAPIVVTFNGSLYDLPFLASRTALPSIISLDLRFLAFRLGLSGSQKSVEAKLALSRPRGVASIRGQDAPALWFRATRGDASSLSKLVQYNYFDVRGLALLLNRLAELALRADGLRGTSPRRRQVFAPPSPPDVRLTVLRDAHIPAIQGDASPVVRFVGCEAERHRLIVGVDLSGSDRRPSGIATVSGRFVETTTIGPLGDIYDFIVETRPMLVSIDAPLCLPAGRRSPFDDDPGRAQYGIMRESERELKRRGVNVYPCLLPSMQNLTSRGIQLAERLREQGIPTIESYPGAAQDMLAMPRKGVGIEFLRTSLTETGLRLPERALTHDELDAITSAIVGVLFVCGYYEPLGSSAEDPLIVPGTAPFRGSLRAIALSGPIGAGKTTAGHYLESLGARYGRYSMVVETELERRGLEPTRATLQRVGSELHREPGQRELGRRLLQLVGEGDQYAIDGIRFRSDVAFLRERFGPRLTHIHVYASRKTRLSRHLAEGGSVAAFHAAELHPVEAEAMQLVHHADHVVTNEHSREDFFRRLREVIERRILVPWVVFNSTPTNREQQGRGELAGRAASCGQSPTPS